MTPDPAPPPPATPRLTAGPTLVEELEAAQEWCRQRSLDVPLFAIARALRDRAARDALPSAERLAEALEDMIVWLEAEAAHPRPDPRPAMRLQAQYARAALAASPSPEDHHD